MINPNECYLGDGVYASIEHGQVKLRTNRGFEDHYIYIDDQVLESFLIFVAKSFNLEISVSQVRSKKFSPSESEERNASDGESLAGMRSIY